jgi:hypothetical protein
MSIAKCYSAHIVGLTAEIITVEVDISNGLNSVSIVGLGDRAVEEAKDRISAAVKNSGYVSPKQKNQKVVISLAPADVRKEGPSFDLPMALAYLSPPPATSEFDPTGTLFLGELSLKDMCARWPASSDTLVQAAARGFDRAFVPADNATEASLASGIRSLRRLVPAGSHRLPLGEELARSGAAADKTSARTKEQPDMSDMRQIRGNETAKRGLEIAAAGAHNILLYGPPGTGKTMLAQSFLSILPPLSREEAVEVTSIHSAARRSATASSRGRLSARRIIPLRIRPSSAAALSRGRARSLWRIAASYSWTNSRNSTGASSKLCASRLEEKTITISRARGYRRIPGTDYPDSFHESLPLRQAEKRRLCLHRRHIAGISPASLRTDHGPPRHLGECQQGGL